MGGADDGRARASARLLVLSPTQIPPAARLLGIDPARCIVVPNGFDPHRMRRVEVDRAAHWRTHLVERPRGWRPGETPGSVRYSDEQAARLSWHEHDTLPAFLSAADVLALASVREQFGQVLVEAMAAELPLIAVDRFGPAEIVEPGQTGWLVEPDDRDALGDALVAAVNDPEERCRRGLAARATAVTRYAWPALARRVAETFEEIVGRRWSAGAPRVAGGTSR